MYKIGCTWNLTTRYASRAALKEVIHVVAIPDEMNIREAERMVHDFFRHRRTMDQGEIFDLSDDDLEMIKRLKISEDGVTIGD